MSASRHRQDGNPKNEVEGALQQVMLTGALGIIGPSAVGKSTLAASELYYGRGNPHSEIPTLGYSKRSGMVL